MDCAACRCCRDLADSDGLRMIAAGVIVLCFWVLISADVSMYFVAAATAVASLLVLVAVA